MVYSALTCPHSVQHISHAPHASTFSRLCLSGAPPHGMQVLLAAGDTFRAAAAEQLAGWAQRSGAAIEAAASDKQRPDALLYNAVDRVRMLIPCTTHLGMRLLKQREQQATSKAPEPPLGARARQQAHDPGRGSGRPCMLQAEQDI